MDIAGREETTSRVNSGRLERTDVGEVGHNRGGRYGDLMSAVADLRSVMEYSARDLANRFDALGSLMGSPRLAGQAEHSFPPHLLPLHCKMAAPSAIVEALCPVVSLAEELLCPDHGVDSEPDLRLKRPLRSLPPPYLKSPLLPLVDFVSSFSDPILLQAALPICSRSWLESPERLEAAMADARLLNVGVFGLWISPVLHNAKMVPFMSSLGSLAFLLYDTSGCSYHSDTSGLPHTSSSFAWMCIGDSVDCWPCPEDQWPNEGQTQCDLRTLQFLSLEEPLGITLSGLTSLLFLISLFVLCVFKRYQDTPIIKANNRELSYVLIIALMLSFLSCFAFIGHPMRLTCMIRQNSFGVVFAISISTVLAKTITVIIAFNARDPTSRSSKWLGSRVPNGVVLLCSFAPVLICTIWLLLNPPFPVKIHMGDTTIIQCDEGSVLFFYLMLGYLGLLATVSFVVAFHARKLPQSFNEANLLTFSMLVFLAVWISFIPAYLSTRGKYMVAVEIFAILSSTGGLLGCIFIPKCYIVLCRPEMNTKQYLMQRPVLQ
ncbi:vomeronasal type-2 receptor 26-like [Lissotriton helveticus]